jgi:hypothetical protein
MPSIVNNAPGEWMSHIPDFAKVVLEGRMSAGEWAWARMAAVQSKDSFRLTDFASTDRLDYLLEVDTDFLG